MANRGKSFLPSSGRGGKIPAGTVGSGPKPQAAANSGKSGKFPTPTSGSAIGLRASGPKSSPSQAGGALKAKPAGQQFPLRSGK